MISGTRPFEPVSTGFAGLTLLRPRIFTDVRGLFVKTFQEGLFRELGLSFAPREEFYSVSAKNVLRGMHFQKPPAGHAKLVFCLVGRVLDVVLDMRRSSETFGRTLSYELESDKHELLFIPEGFAHGFISLQDDSLMYYATDHAHDPANDTGIAWDSFGFEWPMKSQPIISERDRKLPAWMPGATCF
jgi:dTDP-4-dehydrorhamnose 3,5-epimerase